MRRKTAKGKSKKPATRGGKKATGSSSRGKRKPAKKAARKPAARPKAKKTKKKTAKKASRAGARTRVKKKAAGGRKVKKKTTRKPARKTSRKAAPKRAARPAKKTKKKAGKPAARGKSGPQTKKQTKQARPAKKKAAPRPGRRKAKTVARPAMDPLLLPKPVMPLGRKKVTPVIPPARVAAWRMHRQRLDVPTLRAPEDLAVTLHRTGWLNAPSGATPYLALAARYASFARDDLDRAIFQDGLLVVLPTVRDTSMVVPAEEAWIALQAYRSRQENRLEQLLDVAGLMTRPELANLEDVIRAVLAGRPLTVEILEQKVPARLVRDLGEVGAKHSLPTTVRFALWNLVAKGDVLAVQVERRLDRSRQEYVLRRDRSGPVFTADVRPRERDLFTMALAERYFTWAGPARLADFAWWADLTVAEARRAVEGLCLGKITMEGLKGDWFLHEADQEALVDYEMPERPGVALVPFQDTLTASWKSFDGLVSSADLKRSVVGLRGKTVPASRSGPSGTQHHFVIVGGQVAGAWEHRADGVLRYATFNNLTSELERVLTSRAVSMAEFVRRELGEARFYAGDQDHPPAMENASKTWSGRAASISPRV